MEVTNVLMVVLLSLLGCFCCVLVPAAIIIAVVVMNKKKRKRLKVSSPLSTLKHNLCSLYRSPCIHRTGAVFCIPT